MLNFFPNLWLLNVEKTPPSKIDFGESRDQILARTWKNISQNRPQYFVLFYCFITPFFWWLIYLRCGHEKLAFSKSREAQSTSNFFNSGSSALLSKIIGLSYNVFSNYCFAFSSSSSCYLGDKGCPISVQSLGEAASLLKASALAYLERGWLTFASHRVSYHCATILDNGEWPCRFGHNTNSWLGRFLQPRGVVPVRRGSARYIQSRLPKSAADIEVSYIETSITPSFILYKEVTRPASTTRSLHNIPKYISSNFVCQCQIKMGKLLCPMAKAATSPKRLTAPPRLKLQPRRLFSKSFIREKMLILLS